MNTGKMTKARNMTIAGPERIAISTRFLQSALARSDRGNALRDVTPARNRTSTSAEAVLSLSRS